MKDASRECIQLHAFAEQFVQIRKSDTFNAPQDTPFCIFHAKSLIRNLRLICCQRVHSSADRVHVYNPEQPCSVHRAIPGCGDTMHNSCKLNTETIAKNSKLQRLIEDVRFKGGWPLRSELQQVMILSRTNKCACPRPCKEVRREASGDEFHTRGCWNRRTSSGRHVRHP